MNVPNPLSGSNPIVTWANKLRAAVLSQRVRGGRGIRVTQSTDGLTIAVEPGRGGSSPETGGMTYRGVWTNTPTTPYMAQDVVIVLSAGPAAGTYVSITDNNVALPDVGPGWVQIAPGSAIGRWS